MPVKTIQNILPKNKETGKEQCKRGGPNQTSLEVYKPKTRQTKPVLKVKTSNAHRDL